MSFVILYALIPCVSKSLFVKIFATLLRFCYICCVADISVDGFEQLTTNITHLVSYVSWNSVCLF